MKKLILTLAITLGLTTAKGQTPITDYDGNVYQTVSIGTQVWMAENLRTSHYSDGTLIPNNCWYDNVVTDSIYGKLYQWDAVMKNSTVENAQGACPAGWHLPSDDEWIQLFNYVSDSSSCAFALKDTNSSYWSAPLIASNSSGLNLIGGGHGYSCNGFQLKGSHSLYWTSTNINSLSAKNWGTNNQSAFMFRHYNQDKGNNFSVRCVRDALVGINEKESKIQMKVFPNPFSTQAEIQTNISMRNATLTIINILGQTVKQIDNISGNSYILIRENIETGLYIIQLTQENQLIMNTKITVVN